jgi:hypothetical protein
MKKIIKVISIVNVIVIPLIIVLVYLFFKINIITVIRNQESLKIILILIGSSYYISSLFNLFIYKKKSYNA